MTPDPEQHSSNPSTFAALANAVSTIFSWIGQRLRPAPTSDVGEPASDHVQQSAGKVRTRREVLTAVSVGMGGVTALIVAIPVVGALLAPLLRPQPPEWRQVGKVDDFPVGTTTVVTFEDPSPLAWAGVASQTAAWLRRISADQFEAFSVNCTHLGCPVHWIPDATLFMCPCHGGVFYSDGRPAAGPPQRALFLYPVRVRDSQVEVQSGPVQVV
jgi:menaquinol-cytochrome c reductase iron-sulfur subunit